MLIQQCVVNTGKQCLKKGRLILNLLKKGLVFIIFFQLIQVGPLSYASYLMPEEFDFSGVEVNLPRNYGEIRDTWLSGKKALVIMIQDAHCNYDCQKKIEDILRFLNARHGVSILNLEGGAGAYDFSAFTGIRGREARRETVDIFVRQGLVSGAEAFAIGHAGPLKVWGIEDAPLYRKNLAAFRGSTIHKDETDRDLSVMAKDLSALKKVIYSPALADVDTGSMEYMAGKMDFTKYVGFLIDHADQLGISLSECPDIEKVRETVIMEGDIDFRKADKERDRLIEILKGEVPKKSMPGFFEKAVKFGRGEISGGEYHTYLLDRASGCGIDMEEFPDLVKYARYLALYDSIDRHGVMGQIKFLEKEIKKRLFTSKDQEELDRMFHDFRILKDMFGFSLTRDDYGYYKSNISGFDTGRWRDFILEKGEKYGVRGLAYGGMGSLEKYKPEAERFYEYSFKRDDAFTRNIYLPDDPEQMDLMGRKTTVLVAGGFHTENLSLLFRKNDISYISILPSFSNGPGYESPYFDLMNGRKTALDGLFEKAVKYQPGKSMLAIQSLFSQMGIDTDVRNMRLMQARVTARILSGKNYTVRTDWGYIVFSPGKNIEGATAAFEAALPDNTVISASLFAGEDYIRTLEKEAGEGGEISLPADYLPDIVLVDGEKMTAEQYGKWIAKVGGRTGHAPVSTGDVSSISEGLVRVLGLSPEQAGLLLKRAGNIREWKKPPAMVEGSHDREGILLNGELFNSADPFSATRAAVVLLHETAASYRVPHSDNIRINEAFLKYRQNPSSEVNLKRLREEAVFLVEKMNNSIEENRRLGIDPREREYMDDETDFLSSAEDPFSEAPEIRGEEEPWPVIEDFLTGDEKVPGYEGRAVDFESIEELLNRLAEAYREDEGFSDLIYEEVERRGWNNGPRAKIAKLYHKTDTASGITYPLLLFPVYAGFNSPELPEAESIAFKDLMSVGVINSDEKKAEDLANNLIFRGYIDSGGKVSDLFIREVKKPEDLRLSAGYQDEGTLKEIYKLLKDGKESKNLLKFLRQEGEKVLRGQSSFPGSGVNDPDAQVFVPVRITEGGNRLFYLPVRMTALEVSPEKVVYFWGSLTYGQAREYLSAERKVLPENISLKDLEKAVKPCSALQFKGGGIHAFRSFYKQTVFYARKDFFELIRERLFGGNITEGFTGWEELQDLDAWEIETVGLLMRLSADLIEERMKEKQTLNIVRRLKNIIMSKEDNVPRVSMDLGAIDGRFQGMPKINIVKENAVTDLEIEFSWADGTRTKRVIRYLEALMEDMADEGMSVNLSLETIISSIYNECYLRYYVKTLEALSANLEQPRASTKISRGGEKPGYLVRFYAPDEEYITFWLSQRKEIKALEGKALLGIDAAYQRIANEGVGGCFSGGETSVPDVEKRLRAFDAVLNVDIAQIVPTGFARGPDARYVQVLRVRRGGKDRMAVVDNLPAFLSRYLGKKIDHEISLASGAGKEKEKIDRLEKNMKEAGKALEGQIAKLNSLKKKAGNTWEDLFRNMGINTRAFLMAGVFIGQDIAEGKDIGVYGDLSDLGEFEDCSSFGEEQIKTRARLHIAKWLKFLARLYDASEAFDKKGRGDLFSDGYEGSSGKDLMKVFIDGMFSRILSGADRADLREIMREAVEADVEEKACYSARDLWDKELRKKNVQMEAAREEEKGRLEKEINAIGSIIRLIDEIALDSGTFEERIAAAAASGKCSSRNRETLKKQLEMFARVRGPKIRADKEAEIMLTVFMDPAAVSSYYARRDAGKALSGAIQSEGFPEEERDEILARARALDDNTSLEKKAVILSKIAEGLKPGDKAREDISLAARGKDPAMEADILIRHIKEREDLSPPDRELLIDAVRFIAGSEIRFFSNEGDRPAVRGEEKYMIGWGEKAGDKRVISLVDEFLNEKSELGGLDALAEAVLHEALEAVTGAGNHKILYEGIQRKIFGENTLKGKIRRYINRVSPASRGERTRSTLVLYGEASGRKTIVKTIVGVRENLVDAPRVDSVVSVINAGLRDNDYGSSKDTRQVIRFLIVPGSQEETMKNYLRAIDQAYSDIAGSSGTERVNARVVAYAPEMPREKISITGDEAACRGLSEKYGGSLITIEDAYTDKAYPDLTWRAALARHAAFLSRMDESVFKEAYKNLLDYIREVNGEVLDIPPEADIRNIHQLFRIIGPIKIKPVDYHDIIEWAASQKEVFTSL
ncbi:MAG: hypothetical protein ABH883_06145 [Candidatus Omnitrophota bacterium]